MALVQEIVKYLANASAEDVKCACKIRLDNWDDVISRPKVTFGEYVDFQPGRLDVQSARFSLEIMGSSFVRGWNDPHWIPKEDDDLIGERSFVGSNYFHCFECDICNHRDRHECRKASVRILSEAINRHVNFERICNNGYQEFVNVWCDFDDIRKSLKGFDCVGYAWDSGRWVGRAEGEDLFSPSACALALIESFDDEYAHLHMYADVTRDEYDLMRDVSRSAEDADLQQDVLGLFRGIPVRGNGYLDKSKVTILLSEQKFSSICERSCKCNNISSERFQRASLVLFDKASRHWNRLCKNELFEMKMNYAINHAGNFPDGFVLES